MALQVDRRRLAVLAVSAAAASAVGVFDRASPASAARPTSFRAVAAANGLQATLKVPNAPVADTPVDAGGPLSQAVIDSLGTSEALAASPYPGELALAVPGMTAGFTGGSVTPPGYPFVARSSWPSAPGQRQVTPAGALETRSDTSRSESAATAGISTTEVDVGRVSSEAVVEAVGDVVARSAAEVDGFAVGPLRIASLRSAAQVTAAEDGTLTRTSSFRASATVNGTAVEFGKEGLVVSDQTLAAPAATPVVEALRSAGITVDFIAEEPTEHGVIAAGLRLTRQQDLGPGGPGTITWILGQASAQITTGAAPVLPPPTDLAPAPPADQSPAPTEPPSSAAFSEPLAASEPFELGGAGSLAGPAFAIGTAAGDAAEPPPAAPAAEAPLPREEVTLSLSPAVPAGASDFAATPWYGLVAFLGLSAFAGLQALRIFAKRFAS